MIIIAGKALRGLSLPVAKISGEYFASREGADLAWGAILHVIGTAQGTRVMNAEFGSRLLELVFEPSDSVLRIELDTYIKRAIQQWVPYVQVVEQRIELNEYAIEVRLTFTLGSEEEAFTRGFVVERHKEFKIVSQLI